MFFHFAGIIKYQDFMGESHETAFHYLWNVRDNDSRNALRRIYFPDGWQEVGGKKENYNT
jgi:hypothetical protein